LLVYVQACSKVLLQNSFASGGLQVQRSDTQLVLAAPDC